MGCFYIRDYKLTKKWVFESLVTDDKDAIGLIAYALYKNEKHTLASSLRQQGKDEQTIQQEVKIFHDHTLQNNSLGHYKDRATTYLSKLIQKVQDDEIEKYQKEKMKSDKQHQTELKKQRAEILKGMREYQTANKSALDKLTHWLLSGLPGIVSSFLITCFILGASMLLVSEDRRQEVFAELASKYLGVQRTEQSTQPSTKPKPN